VIAYRAILDVPRALAQYLGRLLHAQRHERGTPRHSRALTCFGHAVFALRWFRESRDVPALARDHGVSRATGYRYLAEAIDVLAAQAPDLHDALRMAKTDGAAHVVLDGKLFATDRLAEKTTSVKGEQIDAWYSGKHREPGGNVQAVMAPDGFPLWVSDVAPGSVHDLTTARDQVLGALYWAASQLDLPTLADSGYEGAGIGVRTPVKQPGQRAGPRRGHARLQRAVARSALPGRAWVRAVDRPLAGVAPHHRQSSSGRRHRQSRARAHAFRTRTAHLKFVEINSLDPFAMYGAFLRSDYYGSSAPSIGQQSATDLPTTGLAARQEGDRGWFPRSPHDRLIRETPSYIPVASPRLS
jgi:hypothetical protein